MDIIINKRGDWKGHIIKERGILTGHNIRGKEKRTEEVNTEEDTCKSTVLGEESGGRDLLTGRTPWNNVGMLNHDNTEITIVYSKICYIRFFLFY